METTTKVKITKMTATFIGKTSPFAATRVVPFEQVTFETPEFGWYNRPYVMVNSVRSYENGGWSMKILKKDYIRYLYNVKYEWEIAE